MCVDSHLLLESASSPHRYSQKWWTRRHKAIQDFETSVLFSDQTQIADGICRKSVRLVIESLFLNSIFFGSLSPEEPDDQVEQIHILLVQCQRIS